MAPEPKRGQTFRDSMPYVTFTSPSCNAHINCCSGLIHSRKPYLRSLFRPHPTSDQNSDVLVDRDAA